MQQNLTIYSSYLINIFLISVLSWENGWPIFLFCISINHYNCILIFFKRKKEKYIKIEKLDYKISLKLVVDNSEVEISQFRLLLVSQFYLCLLQFRVWFGISFILLNICMIISTWWWNTVCSCMLYCWTAWCWGSTIPFEKLLNSIAMNFVYQCFWYVTFYLTASITYLIIL